MTEPTASRTEIDSPETAMLAWIHFYAPYGVVTTDREFRIQSWNRWCEIHSGLKSEAVLRQDLFQLFPELRQRGLTPRFQRALEGEISVLSTALHGYLLPMPSPLRESEFKVMQQTARVAPLVLQEKIVGTIVLIEDVTDRETQASVLGRQHKRDRILSWALAHLLEAQDPRRTVRDLFFKVAEDFDFDTYLLFLLDADGQHLRLHGAGGVLPEVEQSLVALESSSPLGSLLVGLSVPQVYVQNGNATLEPAILPENLGLRAYVLLPLAAAEQNLGALCIGTRSRASFGEGEVDLLSTIAKYLAMALHKRTTSLELSAAQARLNLHAQELERQVAERTANLRSIIGELETFSYTLAHDLRAPIRSLIGYSQALLEDYSTVIPEEGRNIISRLHRACTQLDGLTKDLLEYSRVSRQDMQLAPVDLEALIGEVLSIAPPASGKVEVRRPLHRVVGHRSSLQQCLANLIDNAVKFSKEGVPARVRIWTEASASNLHSPSPARTGPFSPARLVEPVIANSQELSMGARANLPRVRIFVEDEGIGIPPEAHDKIFGIFERGTSSSKYSGSGIGLAIVARAIQRMGGSCGVESKPGMGSRFWLELPLA